MNIATQIILSALVPTLLGWCVYRERVIERLRAHRRLLYMRGLHKGTNREREYWMRKRRAELHAAGRVADERPDSGPNARVSRVNIQRRHDL